MISDVLRAQPRQLPFLSATALARAAQVDLVCLGRSAKRPAVTALDRGLSLALELPAEYLEERAFQKPVSKAGGRCVKLDPPSTLGHKSAPLDRSKRGLATTALRSAEILLRA